MDEGRRPRRGVRERNAESASWAATPSRRATTSSGSSTRASGRSDSTRKAPRSSSRRVPTSCTSCTTRRAAEPTSDASKLGLVLAKDPPQEALLLPRGPDGAQPRDSAGGRPRGSRQRDHIRGRRAARVRAATHAPARQGFRTARHRAGVASRRRCSRATSTSSGRWATSTRSRSRCRRVRSSSSSPTSTTRRRNRFNPDPMKKVVWGPQNWDEMSNCFIGVLFDLARVAREGVPAVWAEPPAARRRGPDARRLRPYDWRQRGAGDQRRARELQVIQS